MFTTLGTIVILYMIFVSMLQMSDFKTITGLV